MCVRVCIIYYNITMKIRYIYIYIHRARENSL